MPSEVTIGASPRRLVQRKISNLRLFFGVVGFWKSACRRFDSALRHHDPTAPGAVDLRQPTVPTRRMMSRLETIPTILSSESVTITRWYRDSTILRTTAPSSSSGDAENTVGD